MLKYALNAHIILVRYDAVPSLNIQFPKILRNYQELNLKDQDVSNCQLTFEWYFNRRIWADAFNTALHC